MISRQAWPDVRLLLALLEENGWDTSVVTVNGTGKYIKNVVLQVYPQQDNVTKDERTQGS
jgi:hypothetical protein